MVIDSVSVRRLQAYKCEIFFVPVIFLGKWQNRTFQHSVVTLQMARLSRETDACTSSPKQMRTRTPSWGPLGEFRQQGDLRVSRRQHQHCQIEGVLVILHSLFMRKVLSGCSPTCFKKATSVLLGPNMYRQHGHFNGTRGDL